MDFQTPPPICYEMVSMLPDGVVTVIEPTPGEGNIVRALENRGGYEITAPMDFWKVSGSFDAAVMNPPFTPMEEGYKILYAVMEMCDVIVALMPWLTIINSKKRSRDIKRYGLVSVTHLPRHVFMGSRVQTCILNMRKGCTEKTIFEFYGE